MLCFGHLKAIKRQLCDQNKVKMRDKRSSHLLLLSQPQGHLPLGIFGKIHFRYSKTSGGENKVWQHALQQE